MATTTRADATQVILRPFSDIARHPRSGALGAGRAIAEGAHRPAPSAPLTITRRIARAALEAAALAVFLLAVVTWAAVLMGRV